jgi:hypothetical protein
VGEGRYSWGELLVPRLPPNRTGLATQARKGLCVCCATNISLPHQPSPLDGCPMFAFLRTWVEHELFPMVSSPVYTDLQDKEKEGLRPSCSTHVRKNANMGHPSRGLGLAGSRERGGGTNSQPPIMTKKDASTSVVSHSSQNRLERGTAGAYDWADWGCCWPTRPGAGGLGAAGFLGGSAFLPGARMACSVVPSMRGMNSTMPASPIS